MGKINVLDKHMAELIAAGEVVERPSSVIKELVENSIDAGASMITVEIKHGGITYMRVTDNGCGIENDDIKNAFLRNATSKIKIADDLNNISTLGFRGEALSSICAVSKVELITKTKEQSIGAHYKIDGGEEALFEDYGCPEGTTIIVRDLFYNTPARMKFLKKDNSEANAIAKVLDRIALSHPEVGVKFIKDNKQELNTPGNGEISSAIYAVYGKDFFTSLIELDYKLNGVRVNGFISKPTSSRATRNMQHFFINGRYVKSRTAMVALEEAFKGSIMVQKFPSCVMYIEIPYDTVDVNVHPSKVEVRFVNERSIFEAVYHGVKTALIKGDRSALSINTGICEATDKKSYNANVVYANKPEKKIEKIIETIQEIPQIYIPKRSDNVYVKEPVKVDIKEKSRIIFNAEEILDKKNKINFNVEETLSKKNKVIDESIKNKTELLEEKLFKINNLTPTPNNQEHMQIKISAENEPSIKIKGEIFNTYIIIEKNNDEIVFIDKHAAHERLIFEELKSNKSTPEPQIFLEPIVISLSKDEYEAIIDNISLFIKEGFDVEDFGSGAIIVRSAPSYLDNIDISEIITQMAGYILEHRKNVSCDYTEWLYENIACRAAIKAGKEAKYEEMQVLVKRIMKEDIRYCPHGRPITITVKKRDIEKRFGRM